jgi:HPt (histidine-containing phosphotransfer) domain-containing protein
MAQQNAMKKHFVDPDSFSSLLQDFVDKEPVNNAPGTLIENNDLQGLYEITHDVLPALSYIGADNLAKLAKSIESSLYNKKQANIQGFFAQLQCFEQAMSQLVLKIKKTNSKKLK